MSQLLHEGKLLIPKREMFSLSVNYRGGGQLICEENHINKTIYLIKKKKKSIKLMKVVFCAAAVVQISRQQ